MTVRLVMLSAVVGSICMMIRAAPTTGPTKGFVVFGRVMDEAGKPVGGAKLWAACGHGSLWPTGEAVSDDEGKYRLEFGPRLRVKDQERSRVGIQAATISCGKPGMFEKNLGRQGNLAMSDLTAGSDDEKRWKVQGIVRPGDPKELNFVLAPAAVVRLEMTDESGKPVKNGFISIAGKELPPSCSVLASAHTDERGRAEFTDVPTGRSWWFEWHRPEPVGTHRSGVVNVPNPGAYEVKLVAKGKDIEARLAQ